MNRNAILVAPLFFHLTLAFGVEIGNEVGNGGKARQQFISELMEISKSFLEAPPSSFTNESRHLLSQMKDGSFAEVKETDIPLRSEDSNTVAVQFRPDQDSLLLYRPATQVFEQADLTMIRRFNSYHAVFEILRADDRAFALSLRYATAGMKSSEQIYVASKLYQASMMLLNYVSALYAHPQMQSMNANEKAGEVARLVDAQKSHLDYAVTSHPAGIYFETLRNANAEAHRRAHVVSADITRLSDQLVRQANSSAAQPDDLRTHCAQLLLKIETLLRIVSN